MNLSERSFGGNLFRPRPEIFNDENGFLVIVATPWGQREPGKEILDLINEYITASFQDNEATSPFEKWECLSPLANSVRISLLLSNDQVYRTTNAREYRSGIETFVGAYAHNEFVWGQVGCPNILLLRAGRPLAPINCQPDLSFEMSKKENILSPLPRNLLGVHPQLNANIGSFRPQPGDRLLLISRTYLPANLFHRSLQTASLEQISQLIANDNPSLPFWIGIIDL